MTRDRRYFNSGVRTKYLRRTERLLLAVGVSLLGAYGVVQLHAAVFSRIEVWRFEVSQQVAVAQDHEVAEVDSSAGWGGDLKVDFGLWAEERIEAYKKNLLEQWDAPSALLKIPGIGLEVAVLEGTDKLALNRGVGRIAGTAAIGEEGNVGIAGHRDGFFRGLKDIEVGESIELWTPGSKLTYFVDRIEIVNPDKVEVLNERDVSSLTLVTCYPFYFVGAAPQRFIVYATLKE